jgi:hypothetical protein
MITAWKTYNCRSELSGNSSKKSHLVARQEEFEERNDTFSIRSIFFHPLKVFLIYRKILRRGADGFITLRRKGCCRFLSPLKSIASTGFEPANLGSNGKHANHYINEATRFPVNNRRLIRNYRQSAVTQKSSQLCTEICECQQNMLR